MSVRTHDIPVAHSIVVFTYTGLMGDEDQGMEICHPNHGWMPVTGVNKTELALSKSGRFHAWFPRDSEVVAQWPVRGAVSLLEWFQRSDRSAAAY